MTPEQLRLLRRAVLDHALAEHRRVHLPLLHVGTPGGAHEVHPVRPDEPDDHALRVDIVAAMRSRAAVAPFVWLTRTGELIDQDVDLAWYAAARQAYAEAGAPLVFVVVNRHGWREPGSGTERHWRRLRRR